MLLTIYLLDIYLLTFNEKREDCNGIRIFAALRRIFFLLFGFKGKNSRHATRAIVDSNSSASLFDLPVDIGRPKKLALLALCQLISSLL